MLEFKLASFKGHTLEAVLCNMSFKSHIFRPPPLLNNLSLAFLSALLKLEVTKVLLLEIQFFNVNVSYF